MRKFRLATEADAGAIAAIYAPYVMTPITFDTEAPTASDFAGRIAELQQTYPFLVAEVDGKIVGYAYAHRFRERAAYQWGAELSIYPRPRLPPPRHRPRAVRGAVENPQAAGLPNGVRLHHGPEPRERRAAREARLPTGRRAALRRLEGRRVARRHVARAQARSRNRRADADRAHRGDRRLGYTRRLPGGLSETETSLERTARL